MGQYNRQMVGRSMANELGARLSAHDTEPIMKLGDGAGIAECDVPEWMADRTAQEVNLGRDYHVRVFMVKECHDKDAVRLITPERDYRFRRGDKLFLSGKRNQLERFLNT